MVIVVTGTVQVVITAIGSKENAWHRNLDLTDG